MKTRSRRTLRFLAVLAGLSLAPGCGGRPASWNDPISTGEPSAPSYGLTNGVAIVDDGAHRVVVLTVQPDLSLKTQSVTIGHQVVAVAVSPDATQLFVLSAGDSPQRTANDELPSLTVVGISDDFQAESSVYPMSEALGSLAVDPSGQWAVAYSGATPTAASGPIISGTSASSTGIPPGTSTPFGTAGTAPTFVQNPNEIVIFDLKNPGTEVKRTLQSFGGTPQRLVFTPELELPAGKGPRRLLLIETDIDLTMLDLNHAFDPSPRPEITVPLTSSATAVKVTPAGVVVDGHNASDPNDARFAVWSSNDTNVFAIQLVAPTTDLRNDFQPQINLTDVGGIPTDVAFVETSGAGGSSALQLAALVPQKSAAVLIDPDTSVTTTVTLPAAYSNLSLVTSIVSGTTTTPTTMPATTPMPDVALLWNAATAAASGVALWSLGDSVAQPYRSVQALGTTQPVKSAIDVPPPNQTRKVLQMSSNEGFYVLDLIGGTAPPLTTSSSASLSISPFGEMIWAYTPSGTDLAAIDFKTLNPVPLTTDLAITAVFEVRTPRAQKRPALVAMHDTGALGATVFDAVTPATATSRRTGALLVEAP
ncbi:MAG TPA: hypothetical protein VHV30_11805 [Polyangiaceae bacterium]|jgi:hypothetical protein|nr:hypothetical protein [Polyangiaceae bacterium]